MSSDDTDEAPDRNRGGTDARAVVGGVEESSVLNAVVLISLYLRLAFMRLLRCVAPEEIPNQGPNTLNPPLNLQNNPNGSSLPNNRINQ